jgi:hypothetical protein
MLTVIFDLIVYHVHLHPFHVHLHPSHVRLHPFHVHLHPFHVHLHPFHVHVHLHPFHVHVHLHPLVEWYSVLLLINTTSEHLFVHYNPIILFGLFLIYYVYVL